MPPGCPQCHSLLRPDVIWFGESLPRQALADAFAATEQCDLFFSIGTSALVHPAALLPVVVLQHGTPTVEINPGTTPLTSNVTYALQGQASQILPALVEALED